MTPSPFEYVLYQMFNQPPRIYPFEHIYVDGIFPPNFYQQLLSHLPASEFYTPIDQLGKVAPGSYQERFVFPLIPDKIEILPQTQKQFWQNFLTLFGGEPFIQAAIHLFFETVKERFASARTQPQLTSNFDLVRDTTHYSIGPHTDTPKKLLSLLFYLPNEDSPLDIGTSLFTPLDPSYTDPYGKHHPFDQFKLVTTMPFKANSLFGFVRTNDSWHGVLPLEKEKIERNSIQFQIQISNLQEL